jgi:hypothetical protein
MCWINIASAETDCVYSVRFFAIREIVETVVYFFVGIYLFQNIVAVVLVDTTFGEVSEILVTGMVAEN